MAQMKVLTLENAALLVELTKGEISSASAKSLKTVTIEGNTLKFYRAEEPVGDSLPAYTIELPEGCGKCCNDHRRRNYCRWWR